MRALNFDRPRKQKAKIRRRIAIGDYFAGLQAGMPWIDTRVERSLFLALTARPTDRNYAAS